MFDKNTIKAALRSRRTGYITEAVLADAVSMCVTRLAVQALQNDKKVRGVIGLGLAAIWASRGAYALGEAIECHDEEYDWTDEDFAEEFPEEMDLCPTCGIQQSYPTMDYTTGWYAHKRECPVFQEGLSRPETAERQREVIDLLDGPATCGYVSFDGAACTTPDEMHGHLGQHEWVARTPEQKKPGEFCGLHGETILCYCPPEKRTMAEF